MLKSMTGFGRAEKAIDQFNIKVNLKSVNHRYLDLAVKVPKYYYFVEDKIRRTAANYISRGKVEIYISVERTEGSDKSITLDREVAASYIKALKEVAELGVEDDVKISTIARYGDIFKIETDEADEEYITNMITQVFCEAAEDFVNTRINEARTWKRIFVRILITLKQTFMRLKSVIPKLLRNTVLVLKER